MRDLMLTASNVPRYTLVLLSFLFARMLQNMGIPLRNSHASTRCYTPVGQYRQQPLVGHDLNSKTSVNLRVIVLLDRGTYFSEITVTILV